LREANFYARADIVVRDWAITADGKITGMEYRHGSLITSSPLEFMDTVQQMVIDGRGVLYKLATCNGCPDDTTKAMLALMLSRKDQRVVLPLTATEAARLAELIERNGRAKRCASGLVVPER
jgi:hypothetical protein